MSKDTASKRDQEVAEAAEREAQAQLDIVRALKPLSQKGRQQVMEVVKLLLEADELMPGIMTALGRGLAPPATVDQAIAAGRDAGLNGPNPENCHFRYFATPALTEAWEQGRDHGQHERVR